MVGRNQFRNRSFGLDVSMTKIGDWARTHNLVHDLDSTLKKGYERGSKKAAKKFYDSIRSSIRDGGSKFGFKPLAQSTIDRKLKKGGSSAMFQFYHYYYRSVKMFKKKGVWFVGVQKNKKNPKTSTKGSKYTIAQYASVLENGSRNIPARPLWKMTYKEMGGLKKFRKIILASIIYEFQKRHGIKPTLL